MITAYPDAKLDALRELAIIGSGNAATALSSLLGRPVDIGLPSATSMSLHELIGSLRRADSPATGVVISVAGDLGAVVLLAFPPEDAVSLCDLLGVPTGSELAASALGEVGNIMGCSYIGAVATLAGLTLEPHPPACVTGTLGALISRAASDLSQTDAVVLLDSRIAVEGERCSFDFVFVPDAGAVEALLGRLGVS